MLNGRFSLTRLVVAATVLLCLPLLGLAQDDADPRKPVWAYAITPEMPIADVRGPQPRPAGATGQAAARQGAAAADPTLYTLPGSKFQFTMAQIRSTTRPGGLVSGRAPAGSRNRHARAAASGASVLRLPHAER